MERRLPFDGVLKPLLLFFHFLGFSIITGSIYYDREPRPVYSLLVLSTGIFLIARELYEEGLVWFIKTEGLLTLLKVVLLSAAALAGTFQFYSLVLAILLGAATSHLPKPIKKRVWVAVGRSLRLKPDQREHSQGQ